MMSILHASGYLISVLVWTLSTTSVADDLTKNNRQWLKMVRPLILPEEEELYRNLGVEDRPEFERIFWARRDPSTGSAEAENEFKTAYFEALDDADSSFRTWGDSRSGWDTDCGRVFLLLGPPDMVREGERRPERRQEVLYGRNPEVWTYRGEEFQDGTLQVIFDQYCKLWHSTSVRVSLWNQLAQVARSKVTHRELDYRLRPDGRLEKLEDLLPKPSPAQLLLAEPRQDFSFRAQPRLEMRTQDGRATYMAGLVRGKAEGLEIQSAEDQQRAVRLVIAALAMDNGGTVVSRWERETRMELDDEGFFEASFSLVLPPGQYTLRVGALDTWTRKGAVASFPFEASDYGTGDLTFSELFIFAEGEAEPAIDQDHPLSAFLLGDNQLIPHLDHVFAPSDEIQFLCMVYNATPDPVTGKPMLEATYTILRGGQPLTYSPPQVLETLDAVPMVGPIPLSQFIPGQYIAELKLVDKVTGKAYLQQVPFVVASTEHAQPH